MLVFLLTAVACAANDDPAPSSTTKTPVVPSQAGHCTGWVDNERLPLVTLVDSCKLADESYRVRYTVVPGVGASPLPFEGGEQHAAVGVSKTKEQYFGVDGAPTAYEPSASCTDITS